ncbi:MAG TPA: hypothetical protein VK726_03770 [Acetobacteraceae bacterium]|jgi:hypothetical protein|nr:hypothetical protein [Acetobacteraceae bacterium]
MLVERTLARCATLGMLLASVPFALSAAGDGPPVVVTTDTPEYCHRLIDRISELIESVSQPPPVTVSSLSSEGQRLCDEGHTRPGILRLRRALMLLEQETQSP